MTEYDFSPEAFDRHMATQRRIARWVDQTELHRGEFSSGLSVPPPPGPPTIKGGGMDDYFGNTQRPSPRHPNYTNHRRHSSANVPGRKYASPPVNPQYRHQSYSSGAPMAAPVPLAHYPMGPSPLMVVSPPQSRESQRSRRSHTSATAAYIVAPPPNNTPQYYTYPYPYAPPPPGYAYIAPAGPGQPAVLPPAPANPQAMPYYNPHPSQPFRVPPYARANDPNLPLTYSYSAPAPFASSTNTPPNPGSAAHYLPPHILRQRLYEIGRNHDSRRSRSSSSSDSERGRSSSRDSRDSRDRSHSRGRSRTRKFWWNFTR